jgi:CheY-like chemotaxis protein
MPIDAAGTRARILVVDDEEPIRKFAERTLRAAGYDVVLASDGPQALRIVESDKTPFDLFLIDVLMPLMRGDELARRLRERDPDSKILYFTGFSDQLFEQRDVLWENESYLDKPVTISGLLEAVSMATFGHTRGIERERPAHT